MEVWHRYLGKRLKIQEYHLMDIKKLYNLSKMDLIARPTQILKILQFKFLSTSKQITIKSLRNEVEKQKRF